MCEREGERERECYLMSVGQDLLCTVETQEGVALTVTTIKVDIQIVPQMHDSLDSGGFTLCIRNLIPLHYHLLRSPLVRQDEIEVGFLLSANE